MAPDIGQLVPALSNVITLGDEAAVEGLGALTLGHVLRACWNPTTSCGGFWVSPSPQARWGQNGAGQRTAPQRQAKSPADAQTGRVGHRTSS